MPDVAGARVKVAERAVKFPGPVIEGHATVRLHGIGRQDVSREPRIDSCVVRLESSFGGAHQSAESLIQRSRLKEGSSVIPGIGQSDVAQEWARKAKETGITMGSFAVEKTKCSLKAALVKNLLELSQIVWHRRPGFLLGAGGTF